jgi:L-lactate utilization protein LutB
MGTNIKNLEKYLKLWDIFEEKLKTLNLNLSSFSKEWEKNNETIEENDYNKVHDRLKKRKDRKNNMKRIQESSITQMEIYIKFLDKDFTAQTIRDDETYEYWYD